MDARPLLQVRLRSPAPSAEAAVAAVGLEPQLEPSVDVSMTCSEHQVVVEEEGSLSLLPSLQLSLPLRPAAVASVPLRLRSPAPSAEAADTVVVLEPQLEPIAAAA